MFLSVEIDAANLTPIQKEVLAANIAEVLETARQNGALTAFMNDLNDKTPEIDFINSSLKIPS